MRKALFLFAAIALAAPIAARADSVIGFQTPSHNIGCVLADNVGGMTQLRCDIRSGLNNPHLPPRGNCPTEVDFGQGLWIAPTGPAHIVCAGDTALDPSARVIPYGTSFTHGAFRCDSTADGLTCKNASGHGFFLNRDVWRRF